jgi:lipoyl(octanoyl) transferase
MRTLDLGHLAYRAAWDEQERIHADVVIGGEEAILLVEHPPVITMGRRGETLGVTNLRASDEVLRQRGVEFVQTDRGGDITFHGPGQLVAYPIVRLIDHKLSVGAYVRLLQNAVIDALARFDITGHTDHAGIGIWVNRGADIPVCLPLRGSDVGGTDIPVCVSPPVPPQSETQTGMSVPPPVVEAPDAAKICALGVRVKRGVTLHGLALNVTTDLSYFDLIVPCGIADRSVTSMRQILGDRCPIMADVKAAVVKSLRRALGEPG